MHLPDSSHHTYHRKSHLTAVESSYNLKGGFNKEKLNVMRFMFRYLRSSAVMLRWNLDFSFLMTEESTSSPFANSTFPICKTAATTLKIATWNRSKNVSNIYMQHYEQRISQLHTNLTCSSSLIPTTSIALLVARYSSPSSIPSSL